MQRDRVSVKTVFTGITAGSCVAVTGAFGYSGRHITARLLDSGLRVVNLTRSPQRPDCFDGRVETRRMAFDNPSELAQALSGVDALVNTYWVRFNHARFTHELAVRNSRTLFQAARQAKVRRVVHVSITNPSLTSPLSYFRGKAQVEQTLVESGLSPAILRPAVFFGGDDILLNNIAWALRRFPVFAVFGRGDYRLRPIHVDDFARRVLDSLRTAQPAVVTQAVGPETFSYRDLVGVLGRAVGCARPLLPVPPMLGWLLGRVVGLWQHDTFITRDEIRGLMTGLLDVAGPAAGPTRLTDWTSATAATLGWRYASEMARRTAPHAAAHRSE